MERDLPDVAGSDVDDQLVVSRRAFAPRVAVFQALAEALRDGGGNPSGLPVVHDVVPPERIVCTLPLTWPGGPREVLATFTLEDEEGGVVVTMIASPVRRFSDGAPRVQRRLPDLAVAVWRVARYGDGLVGDNAD